MGKHAVVRTGWLVGAVLALAACGEDNGGWGSAPEQPTLLNPTHVWAFSPTDVWVLDGSAIVHRFDGSAWSEFQTPSTGGLGCIFALSPTEIWLCASSQILHYDGTTFTMSEVTASTGLDGLSAIWASSQSDVFAVGDDAIVAHWNGTTWSRTITGSPFKSSIWGAAPNDVYALGTFDLVHYNGVTWDEIDLDAGAGDGQVWGTSASDVWVVPGSEHLSHYDGTTWTAVDLDLVGDLTAVWGPTPDDLWAAGSAGAIAHYDGSSWDQVAHQDIGAPYLRQFVSVHGSGADNMWMVGHQLGEGGSKGLIYRRP